MSDESMVGTVGRHRGVVGHHIRRAWPALLLTLALWLPAGTAANGLPHQDMFIDDGGGGSTVCVNVPTYRYYLCIRADGSVYRIYY